MASPGHVRTAARERFETWLLRVRVMPDLATDANGQYIDLDTLWMWMAYQQGMADRRN